MSPVYVVPPDQIPARTLRTLRRSLPSGVTLQASSTLSWNPAATHIVLTNPVPSLPLVCAIAAAGTVHIVNTAHLEALSSDKPPPVDDSHLGDAHLPSDGLLWAGRIWLGAYAIWKQRRLAGFGLPLSAHRVITVGELRPRGVAGAAAASTAIIHHVLLAAGAKLVSEFCPDEPPTFAILAPGLSPESSAQVQALVEEHVLCLGSAFVIDLIVRVAANPADYVLFDRQKSLCASPLNVEHVSSHASPLPISVSQLLLHKDKPTQQAHVEDMQQISFPNVNDTYSSDITKQSDAPSNETGCGKSTPSPKGDVSNVDMKERTFNLRVRPAKQSKSPVRAKIRLRNENDTCASARSVPKEGLIQAKIRLRNVEVQNVPTPMVQSGPEQDKESSAICLQGPHQDVHPSGIAQCVNKDKAGRISNCAADMLNECSEPTIAGKEGDVEVSIVEDTVFQKGKIAKSSALEEAMVISTPPQRTRRRLRQNVTDEDNAAPASLPCSTRQCATDVSEQRILASKRNTILRQEVIDVDGPHANIGKAHFSVSPITPPDISKRLKGGVSPLRVSSDSISDDGEPIIRRRKKLRHTPTKSGSIATPVAFPVSQSGKNENVRAVKSLDFISPVSKNVAREKEVRSMFDSPISNHDELHNEAPALDVDMVGAEGINDVGSGLSQHRSRQSKKGHRLFRSQDVSILHMNEGSDSDDDAISEFPRGVGKSFEINGEKQTKPFSLEVGYQFLLGKAGGEPNEKDIKRMLKSIGVGSDSEEEEQPDSTKGNPTGKDDWEMSPEFEDEGSFLEGSFNRYNMREGDSILPADSDGVHLRSSQRRKARNDGDGASQKVEVDAFRIPLPSRIISLPTVIPSEFSCVEKAKLISITPGNVYDDRDCQGKIEYTHWIFAAENLVGVSGFQSVCSSQGASAWSCRRMWLSMFESGVLDRLASGGGLNEAETNILTAVCIRLLAFDNSLDIRAMVAGELLNLRERQISNGFDSLQIVLSSKDLNAIPLRHRAIASIWTTLIRDAIHLEGTKECWLFFNKAIDVRIENLFSNLRLDVQSIEASFTSVIQAVMVIGYMFAVKQVPDDSDGYTEQSVEDFSSLCPENWSVVCRFLNKFCESNIFPDGDVENRLLAFFLRTIAVHISGLLWQVTVDLLTCTSRAIAACCSVQKVSCSCAKTPVFASQFRILADANSERAGLSSHLATACDCAFFLGWLYTMRGDGNSMKRAMSVVRSGAPFTRTASFVEEGSVRTVYHHVGLLLAVGDSMASSSKEGEYLLCRMLTAKCPRLENILQSESKCGGDRDLGWRSMLEAVSVRCQMLLARGESVHVYTDWLSQNVIQTFCIIRKSTEKRPLNVVERESLRVQESMMANLAMLMITTLIDITKSLLARASDKGKDGVDLIEKAAEKSAGHIPSFIKFAGEIVCQVHANPEEAVGKNKHVLMCALLSLVENEVKLILQLVKMCQGEENARSQNARLESRNVSLDKKYPSLFAFVSDCSTENVVMNVIGGGEFFKDEKLSREAKKSAGCILAQVVEIRWMQNGFANKDGLVQELVGMLQRGNLDATYRFEKFFQRYNVSSEAKGSQGVEDRSRLAFWLQAFDEGWTSHVITRNSRLEVMCVCNLMSCIANENEEWDDEDRDAVRKVADAMQKLDIFKELISPWISQLQWLGRYEDYMVLDEKMNAKLSPKALAMESGLRYLAVHWTGPTIRNLLKHLRHTLRLKMKQKFSRSQCDSLLIYCGIFSVESQLNGFVSGNGGRWMQGWLEDISQCIVRMRNHHESGNMRSMYYHVQRRMMSGLCMGVCDGRDVEMRVQVLRVISALPDDDRLKGIWETVELPTVDMNWERRALRNAEQWQKFVFDSVVEDALFGQSASRVGWLIGRLSEAGQVAFREGRGEDRNEGRVLRAVVRAVVGRLRLGGGGVMAAVERDVRAFREWEAICRLMDDC